MTGAGSGLLAATVSFAIRFRGIVVALACLVAGYGAFALTRSRYDVFPEFAPPQVQIQTEAPGLAPEQTEAMVTLPIENALSGTPGVRSLLSRSIEGLSVISVMFEDGTDVYRDRQLVTERLTSVAGGLPAGVRSPVLTPLTSATGVILIIGLTSVDRSLMAVRALADWTVRRRLLAVKGVADVAVFGRDMPQLQILVHPEALVRLGIGLGDVLSAARRATGVRGAGFIETRNQRIVLRSRGQALTPEELKGTVLRRNPGGAILTLGSVADVMIAPSPPIGAAAVMGTPGVVLQITGQYGANTVEVTRRLYAALDELGPVLEAEHVTLHPRLFRPADFIHTAVGNVRNALLLGGVLVIAVLFLFLFDLRTAAISCVAIPLSLLAGIIVLRQLGVTLNTMTLGGLAIAIGEVVDDAVIDVENIVRRLRENRRRKQPEPRSRVVLDASLEVRGAVVYATFAVVLVFVPVLVLPGVAGRLFAPLALAYIAVVLASLLVALTVTPALAMLLLAGRDGREKAPPITRRIRGHYRALLGRLERRPRRVMGLLAGLSLAAAATVPFLRSAFLPELREGHFVVHMTALPGTSLDESLRIGRRVTGVLLNLPFVRSVSQRVGRAERISDVSGPQSSEFEVDLKPLGGKEAESAAGRVREVLVAVPGVNFAVNTFLTERIEETLSGFAAPVVVKLYGPDLDTLDLDAREAADLLRRVAGAADVQIQAPAGMPQLSIELRRPQLTRWGFTPIAVLSAVETGFQGASAGQVYQGNRIVDVSVLLDSAGRATPADVGRLTLRNAAGTFVRLDQLADIRQTSGRYQVLHLDGRRVQTVTANVVGRDVPSFVRDAKRSLRRGMKFSNGAYFELSGTGEAGRRARHELLLYSILAGGGIVLLLWGEIRRARNVVLILVNLPFALVGGLLAVFGMGGVVSLGILVGFVTLFGITLRNSILMISHFEHLVTVEGMPWGVRAAHRGAADRLAPILMTSLVTGFGLLPLALGMDAPGREIEGPMAAVILGGLLTSMTLNLLVLPTLAVRFGRFGPPEEP